MPEFHYSCTWGTWSRVLSTTDPHGPIVEVNLTPVHDWASEVAQIRIRFHGTPFGHCSYDKVTTELPARVRQQMVEKLGEELTERLLTEDSCLRSTTNCIGGTATGAPTSKISISMQNYTASELKGSLAGPTQIFTC